ncbi:PmoA family protein [Streptomyces cocklensis]|uniref:Methane oxygenase PmoA n=1 Tax=Actinacidiphila cocklensis TaxID=887465 RepID=A0A9W4GUV0_9ACTN|nr:PmoA family protein [Actinacidiphila cocklensis]MDD1062187.1 PmoA family protein [Actinacidiphila cocklensis]CAG6397645.1 Methane oxygenase PmoA [Actinacidiphila cocklensis]
MTAGLPLRCGGHTVGTYVHRPDIEGRLSPRPYLHPLTTLGGTAVTEVMPDDHPHHLGAGIAVPDVAGRNFWGGRTYVRDRGPTELDNHGEQRHLRFTWQDDDGFTEELSWTADGTELLREERTLRTRRLSSTAWELDLAFTLANSTAEPLRIGSPATNGRPGAGYGGFFWRAPRTGAPPLVFTADAAGEDAVHGSRADWLALAGERWTLVLRAADPWFVRTREYPGVGSALAWRTPLTVPAGGTLTRRVVTAVADGRLGPDEAAALAARTTR